MFWDLFKKKPAPKPEQEKKDQESQPMRLDDFCKYREGYFTENGHPANINYPRV